MRPGFDLDVADFDTVFLDAGNTLISMDYDWILREFAAENLATDLPALERAEAAARPETSRYVASTATQASSEAFEFHLGAIFDRVTESAPVDSGLRREMVARIAGRLKRPGEDFRLWSRILPGVPEALQALSRHGFKLVVVSNSDGSVARALSELGLEAHLTAVLDSAVVGFEKPDARFFEHALETAGSRPESSLHVGDMYYQDVQGARAAGIEAVLLDPYGDWAVDDCVCCRDLPELARLLARDLGNSRIEGTRR